MCNKVLNATIKDLKETLKQQAASNFSCLECENQHKQILNWLIELKDYEDGKIGKNLDDPTINGYLTLDEAITHTQDVINTAPNQEIKNQHEELLEFLQKLKSYRNQ